MPTFNPTFINNFEYGICLDLINHIDILYDITQFECINYCKQTNSCRMINHYQYFKRADDFRCYIFNSSCKLSYHSDSNPSSTVWFKQILGGYNNTCIDYPPNWKDITGDSCNIYQHLEWCLNNTISSPYTSNDFELLKDNVYGLNAANVCCQCSYHAGLHILNYNIDFVYENHEFNNQALCKWQQQEYSHQKWQSWDNLILYEWCVDIQERFNLINELSCNYLIDSEYILNYFDGIDINLCDYNLNTNDTYYFMLLLKLNEESNIFSTYINVQWFDINTQLFSSAINLIHSLSYESCVLEAYDDGFDNINTTIYGIYPCLVSDTNNPTKSPTHDPTVQPTAYPTNIPSTDPTNEPTIVPTINPTINPTTNPITNPPTNPTIYPSSDPTTNPTLYPSATPSKQPITTSINNSYSLEIISTNDNREETISDGSMGTNNLIIIIMSFILLIVFIILVMAIIWIRKKPKELDITELETVIQKTIKTISNADIVYGHKPSTSQLDDNKDDEKYELSPNYCILCCDNIANMFNSPCGHVTYCRKCAADATQQDSRCPNCRTEIECKQIYDAGFSAN